MWSLGVALLGRGRDAVRAMEVPDEAGGRAEEKAASDIQRITRFYELPPTGVPFACAISRQRYTPPWKYLLPHNSIYKQ